MAQEVFLAGVLVQPPDEIADGVEKLLLPAGRRVEQQVAVALAECAPLMIRHAFQHLKIHALIGCALLG